MGAWFRILVVLTALFGGGQGSTGSAAEAVDSADSTLTPASLVSRWQPAVSIHSGFGYRDNVLLSHFAPTGSAFAENGLEVIVFRLPDGNTDFQAFFSGDDIRYFNGQAVNKEQNAVAQIELRQHFNANWQAALIAQYIYQDQVLDSSTDPTLISSVRAQSQEISIRSPLRYELPRQCWAELELSLDRLFYAAPLNSYWEGGPKFTLGHAYGNGSEITLSYQVGVREYDSLAAADPAGLDIPGTQLEEMNHRVEAIWKHHFDAKRTWRLTSKAAFERNVSTGSDFFAYRRYRLAEQFRVRSDPWEVQTEIRANRTAYDLQTAIPDSGSLRVRDDLNCTLRVERKVGKLVKLFTNYEFGRVFSNLKSDEYVFNTATAGVLIEF